MKRAWLVVGLGVSALLLLAAACREEEDAALTPAPTTATPTAATATVAVPTATAVASPIRTPRPGRPTLDGEEVELLVNALVQEVTVGDETVQETVPHLIVRTVEPGASSGYRTVARFRDGRWQVSIHMRLRDPSGDPLAFLDLRADFFYDEKTGEISGANGRAQFALTGENPCSAEEIESGDCDLDEPAFP